MDRRNFIAGTAGLLPVAVAAQVQTLRDRVLGAWRILDAETVNVATGVTKPWRGRPRPYSGIIIYLPNGLMSVQIGAARSAARVGAGFDSLTDDEIRQNAQTWYAYYAARIARSATLPAEIIHKNRTDFVSTGSSCYLRLNEAIRRARRRSSTRRCALWTFDPVASMRDEPMGRSRRRFGDLVGRIRVSIELTWAASSPRSYRACEEALSIRKSVRSCSPRKP